MYLKGIEHSTAILAPEAKEQVKRELKKRKWHKIGLSSLKCFSYYI
jgi:hypothetical protein